MVFVWQKRERQNVGHVTPKSSVHSALLIFGMVVTDILTVSTFQDQNEEFSMWFCGLRCFAADQNALCAF